MRSREDTDTPCIYQRVRGCAGFFSKSQENLCLARLEGNFPKKFHLKKVR